MPNPNRAGRKKLPIETKKVVVRIYIPQSVITAAGSIEAVQQTLYKALNL